MKKSLLTVVLGVGLAGSVSAFPVSWSAGEENYLWDSAGNVLDPDSNTYQIQLVVDVSGNTDMSALLGGYIGLTGDSGWGANIDASASDDVVFTLDMRSWTGTGGGGGYIDEPSMSAVPDIYVSTPFYFRWFNSDSQATATEAGFIYGFGGVGNLSGWVTAANGTAPTPTVSLDYTQSGVTSLGADNTPGTNDGWATIAPVPEPGTIALFALGVATLAASRRRKARA